MLPWLAAFGDEVAPVIASVMVFMIPIVAILTHHQRKMAQLIHGDPGQGGLRAQTDMMLRAELADLRGRIDNLTLAVEQMRSEQKALTGAATQTTPPSLTERLG